MAQVAISISDLLPDAEAFNVDWSADNFRFYDSVKKNAKNTSISPGFIFTICFFAVFIIC